MLSWPRTEHKKQKPRTNALPESLEADLENIDFLKNTPGNVAQRINDKRKSNFKLKSEILYSLLLSTMTTINEPLPKPIKKQDANPPIRLSRATQYSTQQKDESKRKENLERLNEFLLKK